MEGRSSVHVDCLGRRLWLVARLTAVALIGLLRLLRVVPTLTLRWTWTKTTVNDITVTTLYEKTVPAGG